MTGAVILHGYPRLTGDVDLLEPGIVVQFGRPPNRVDLIGELGTVSFDRAWRRRVSETLRTSAGRRCSIHFIGARDLIQSKRDAGRHKDLDDVEHLEALLATTRERRRKH